MMQGMEEKSKSSSDPIPSMSIKATLKLIFEAIIRSTRIAVASTLRILKLLTLKRSGKNESQSSTFP